MINGERSSSYRFNIAIAILSMGKLDFVNLERNLERKIERKLEKKHEPLCFFYQLGV